MKKAMKSVETDHSIWYNVFIKYKMIWLLVISLSISYFFGDRPAPSSVLTQSHYSPAPCIVIDPGHGGFDGGCVGADGTVEKDINLDISLKIQSLLQSLGYDTVMIRTTDTSVESDSSLSIRQRKKSDINNRFSVMKSHPNGVYLCIHQNNFSSSSCHGAQIFYRPDDDMSKTLASSIQTSITKSVQTDNKRQIKPCTDDVYLIYHATTVAVLVECGFLSNPDDLKNLKSSDYQDKIASAIVDGLLNWMSE